MLRSMTGFGAASQEGGALSVHVEIRSVNHRHLLVKSRLPQEVSGLDAAVETQVKKRLARGSVSVALGLERTGAEACATIDAEVAARYQQEVAHLAEKLGLEPGLSMDALLALPGVVGGENGRRRADSRLEKLVLGTIDEALLRLVEMRETEGRAIEEDLRKHAAATAKLVRRIERRMPTVVRAHQRNLEKRVGELLSGQTAIQPADVAREAALLADRLDVSEEVARLDSHLVQLDTFLEKGGRIGRKLDFLVQEIFREINTIGAKCSDAKVSHWVVEAKTHAERLREQVQNVE